MFDIGTSTFLTITKVINEIYRPITTSNSACSIVHRQLSELLHLVYTAAARLYCNTARELQKMKKLPWVRLSAIFVKLAEYPMTDDVIVNLARSKAPASLPSTIILSRSISMYCKYMNDKMLYLPFSDVSFFYSTTSV